jgi:hypothetical protein
MTSIPSSPSASTSTSTSLTSSSSTGPSSTSSPRGHVAEKAAEKELAELLKKVPEVYFRNDFSVATQV